MCKHSAQLSVIVCTQNRANLAIDCMDALLSCPRADDLELIVIDNASRETESRLLRQGLEGKRVLLEREPTPGISRARNFGSSIARTEWIAYLDDDALPFSNWAEAALDIITNRDAEKWGMIGGAVLPQWPQVSESSGIEPSRLGDRWRTLLSLVDKERIASGSQLPEVVGCNMLLRRSVLEQVGGFPLALGRTPDRFLGGEETEVARKIHASGFLVRFEPALNVYHRIHPERLSTTWIRRRAKAEGELLWKCSPTLAMIAKTLLSIPYLAVASSLRSLPNGAPADYDHHVRLWNNLGFLNSALSALPNLGKIARV